MLRLLWRTIWRFLKKLKIEFPHDPAILLDIYFYFEVHIHLLCIYMGIYSNKTIMQKDTCTSVFTAQEVGVQSLGWEDLLEKEMVTHSSIVAWKIPWTEPGRLQAMESQTVGHD